MKLQLTRAGADHMSDIMALEEALPQMAALGWGAAQLETFLVTVISAHVAALAASLDAAKAAVMSDDPVAASAH